MVVLMAFHAWQDRAHRLESAQDVNSSLAHALLRHAEDTFGVADAMLVSVVDQLEHAQKSPAWSAQLERQLALQVAQSPDVADLSVFDENGALLMSSKPWATRQIGVTDRSDFQHHRNTPLHAAFLGFPSAGTPPDVWKLTMSRRWNTPDRGFAGMVVASLSPSFFASAYEATSLGPRAGINLFHTDGQLLFRYPADDKQLGRSFASQSLFQTLLPQRPFGKFRYIALIDGVDRVAAYDGGSRFPIVVNVASSVDDVLAGWIRETLWDILITGALLVLVGYLGFRLTHQAVRQQRVERALSENELHFRLLTEMSGDMVTRIGRDGRRTYVSPASIQLLGWRPEELLGTRALHAVNLGDKAGTDSLLAALAAGTLTDQTIAYRAQHRDGHEIWVEANIRTTVDVATGECTGAVIISRDTTERKKIEAGLAALATTDGLTGIANRRRLDEGLRSEWRRSAREGTVFSFALMDVDRFKAYNDIYGHLAGDECLRMLTRILSASMRRPGDLLARYGGEELGALLPVTEAAGAWEVAEAARLAIQAAGIPHEGSLPEGVVTLSIGVATAYPTPAMDLDIGIERLLRAADRALYVAKNGGRNRVAVAQVTDRPVPDLARTPDSVAAAS